MSRSAIDMIATPSGQRHRAVPLTHPTPMPCDTRHRTGEQGSDNGRFLSFAHAVEKLARYAGVLCLTHRVSPTIRCLKPR
jgi:hypothetical protein